MKLTLINHASCKVETKTLGILMDVWVDGPAFNFGWDLLIPTPFSLDEIMAGVTYVWISHEHPDHFSVPFLVKMAKSYKDKVTILFQKTRDKRVVNFCASQGLKYQELEDRVPTRLNDEVTVICGVTDFYDSWLNITDGDTSIFNLNDCHTRTDADFAKIKPYIPKPTLLLSQFSYASWKGGKDNSHYRGLAATQKLETLARQVRLLEPEYTLPFASFIYFSNQENNYLNDLVNTPVKAAQTITEAGSQPVVLYPGDSWQLKSAVDNSGALAKFETCYSGIDKLPLRDAGKSSDFDELSAAFQEYQTRVFSKNSRFLIELASRMKPLNAFRTLSMNLYDIDTLISFNILRGMTKLNKTDLESEVDIKMHSSSLLFILKNDFGFDTLMVNGRLECSPSGFSKMTKSLSIGSLNAMGLSLSPGLIFDFHVIIMLLNILSGVLSKLKQSEKKAASITT